MREHFLPLPLPLPSGQFPLLSLLAKHIFRKREGKDIRDEHEKGREGKKKGEEENGKITMTFRKERRGEEAREETSDSVIWLILP